MKNLLTANRLKSALAKEGISQQELADRACIGKGSISQYVNGTHAPSNVAAQKISSVLKVNPLWLMGFDAPEELPQELSREELLAEPTTCEIVNNVLAMDTRTKEHLLKYIQLLKER